MSTAETSTISASDNPRARLRRALFIVGPAAAVAIAAWAFVFGGRYVDTDDAYVKADKVNISPEVTGPILEIPVHENQVVKRGDVLLRLDPKPFELAVQQAEADLQSARLAIESLKASYRQKLAAADSARADLDYQQRRYRRIQSLRQQGVVSQSEMDDARHGLDVANNRVAELDHDVAETLAELSGRADVPAEQHPRFLTAQSALDKARLNLERSVVRAPMDGIASKVPEVGAYAAPGLPLMSVVAQDDVWVEANFKESELEHLRPGQSVEVKIDSYPDTHWDGTVDSIGQATGAEFALLPAQNATGNWVKVVQRIPVRIRLAHKDDEPALRSGMSAIVTVDTGRNPRAAALARAFGVGNAEAAPR
jgi:membrane fusion protein (multidrug efflux system)